MALNKPIFEILINFQNFDFSQKLPAKSEIKSLTGPGKKSIMRILNAQDVMPCVLKKKLGCRKCPIFEMLPVFLESYSFFFKNQTADSEVISSLKLTWCLSFLCVICYNLFFVEKLIWTSEKFTVFFIEVSSLFENYKLNRI